jgi:hypothetical protein
MPCRAPTPLILALSAILLVAAELGFRVGRRIREPEDRMQASAVQGTVLGLVALLLGFTFSMAMDRYEARKELLRDEANAIGTTLLRAQLLPEPMRSRVPGLLRSYVDTRFELTKDSFLPEKLQQVHQRSLALQDRLWAQAVAAAAERDSEMTSLFVDSLNETIDMHGKRMAAIRNRIPMWIMALLLLLSTVGLGLTGYASGPSHRRAFLLNALVALLIATVTILIVDLHRPAQGAIQIDMSSMVDLRDSMTPATP